MIRFVEAMGAAEPAKRLAGSGAMSDPPKSRDPASCRGHDLSNFLFILE
jgi:hypothetical protein